LNYHIGICDDDAAFRQYLSGIVRAWAASSGHDIDLQEYPGAENYLFRAEESVPTDILFLDIEMGGMDGVTLAKQLRRTNETMQIIFVTGYSDYIEEGYEVSALHYLMKPAGEDKIRAVLDRAASRLDKNERTLKLKTADGLSLIPLRAIRHIRAQGNYLTVSADEEYRVRMTLSEISGLLDDRFLKISRSDIINLRMVSRTTRAEVFLSDGTSVPLPRGAYEPLNRAIINME